VHFAGGFQRQGALGSLGRPVDVLALKAEYCCIVLSLVRARILGSRALELCQGLARIPRCDQKRSDSKVTLSIWQGCQTFLKDRNRFDRAIGLELCYPQGIQRQAVIGRQDNCLLESFDGLRQKAFVQVQGTEKSKPGEALHAGRRGHQTEDMESLLAIAHTRRGHG